MSSLLYMVTISFIAIKTYTAFTFENDCSSLDNVSPTEPTQCTSNVLNDNKACCFYRVSYGGIEATACKTLIAPTQTALNNEVLAINSTRGQAIIDCGTYGSASTETPPSSKNAYFPNTCGGVNKPQNPSECVQNILTDGNICCYVKITSSRVTMQACMSTPADDVENIATFDGLASAYGAEVNFVCTSSFVSTSILMIMSLIVLII